MHHPLSDSSDQTQIQTQKPKGLKTLQAGLVACGAAFLALLPGMGEVSAQESVPEAAQLEDAELPQFIRSTSNDDDGTVQLEIAVRKFVPRDGDGPAVWLAGAVHIGDAAYYEALQDHLDGADLVLYEGVGRPELFSVNATDDASRVLRTKLGFRATQELIGHFASLAGGMPNSIADVREVLAEENSVAANYLFHATTDGWGNAVLFARENDAITLTSLGADGALGGEGFNEDINFLIEGIEPGGNESSEITDLQQTLARAFGVVFQMNGIDYDRPHFYASDMSEADLIAAMEARGLGGEGGQSLIEAIGGPNAQAMGMMQMLAGFIEQSPRMQHLARFMMIEVLSQDDLMEAAMNQNGSGMFEIIIDDRNQVVIDDLKAVLEAQGSLRSISIFYGVGHFDDLAERMDEQLDYVPTEVVIWLPAMRADLGELGMSPAMVDRMKDTMRTTLRRAMEQMEERSAD